MVRDTVSLYLLLLISTGPWSSVTVLGQTVVIINDRELAVQILEKNSAKHSSRPRLVFADELYVFFFFAI